MNGYRMVKAVYVFIILGTMQSTADAVDPVEGKTLCNTGEEAFFSCELDGTHKTVSVCARRNVPLADGYVQYRYGTREKIEFKYPSTLFSSKNTMSIIDVSRSAFGIGTHLKFIDGGYHYVISNALIPGELYVTKNGKIVFEKICRGGTYVPFSDNYIYRIPAGVLEKIDGLDGH